MTRYRTEKDTLGSVKVPVDKYYGAQTQRAVDNFPISGFRLPESFVKAQAVIKKSAAKANMQAGVLDKKIAGAVISAADEIILGRHDDQFVVDVYQAGAGTSQNMNMNEVLANRAEEILGGKKGAYKLVHPNDHANMSQSTNDTIHTAIHLAAAVETHDRLLPSSELLEKELRKKAKAFDKIIKCGRTHLQDAVPVRMGRVFGAFAAMVAHGREAIGRSMESIMNLPLGGTAVGTGLNTPAGYRKNVMRHICKETGMVFKSAPDMMEAMQSMGPVVEFSGALRVLSTSLKKIADDFRLMGSGPRTGLGELDLPPVQPGSSIMPGKVNPVMAEMLDMVVFQTDGCDAAVVRAAQAGQLELNVMMPVIAFNLLHSIKILASAMGVFAVRCVRGIKVNKAACRLYAERSAVLATALSPVIGYHRAAELANEALKKNVLLRDLAVQKKLLSVRELNRLLDVSGMADGIDEEEAAAKKTAHKRKQL